MVLEDELGSNIYKALEIMSKYIADISKEGHEEKAK